MNTTRVYIKKRPVKIGFLIEEGNIDDLVKIAGINTLLWGGIYNPIIPVNNGERLSDNLIKTFDVDIISSEENNKKINDFIKNREYLKICFESDSVFFDQSKTIFKYVDIRHLIYYIWDEFLKNKNNDKINYYIVNWDKKDPLNKLFSIDFGYLDNIILSNIKEIYLDYLSAKEIKINCNEVLCEYLEMPFNPITLTIKGLHNTYRNTPQNLCLYIGDENNFNDLLNYWNIRACGCNIMFLPKNHLERYKKIIQKRINRLSKPITGLRGVYDKIGIYYRSAKDGEIKKLLDNFNIKQKLIYSKCSNEIWNGLNLEPVKYYFSEDETLGIIEKKYDNLSINIHFNKKLFQDTQNIGIRQKYIISIDTHLNDIDFPDCTINIPKISQLNEFYTKKIMHFIDKKVRGKSDNSIDVITELNDSFLILHPVKKYELIKEIFKYIGFEAEYSQAGIITKNIIEKFGGLQGCRVFKIRGVRELLNSLNKEDFVSSGYVSRKICSEGQLEKYKDLFIEPRENRELTEGDVFNFLLKKRVLMPGFELICEKCNQKNWNSIDELKENWKCNYCDSINKIFLQLKTKAHLKLRYRKSGLFAKDNNQEGAIPVILTLIQFDTKFHSFNKFIHTPSLKLHNSLSNCEVDFCVLNVNILNGEIEIGIAECKSEGGNIDIKDIENMKLIRDKFQEKDINCYLIFSKTSDQFTSNEIKLFEEKLYRKDIPFILFTNKELEPYLIYAEYPKSKIFEKPIFSLKGMAQNTSSLYMGDNNINNP